MAGFFQKRPYREAPSQLPHLADHLPIVKRLVACWCMANGTAHDLGPHAVHGTKSQHVSMPTTRHGRAAFHNTTQEATPIDLGSIASTHPLAFAGTQMSVFGLIKLSGFSNNFGRWFDKSTAGFSANGYGAAFVDDGSVDFYSAGAAGLQSNASVIALNTWYAVGISVNGGSGSIYVNGIDETSDGILNNIPTATANMSLMGWNHSASRVLNGYVPFLPMWDYPLSAAEQLRLARDPFKLFERRVWVPVGGAPPAANPKGPLGHPLQGALGGPI